MQEPQQERRRGASGEGARSFWWRHTGTKLMVQKQGAWREVHVSARKRAKWGPEGREGLRKGVGVGRLVQQEDARRPGGKKPGASCFTQRGEPDGRRVGRTEATGEAAFPRSPSTRALGTLPAPRRARATPGAPRPRGGPGTVAPRGREPSPCSLRFLCRNLRFRFSIFLRRSFIGR